MSEIEPQLPADAPPSRACSGRALAELLSDLADWFAGYVDHLNALNVFPVPDGDTGTNMARTLRSAADAASTAPDDVAEVLQAAARGALMGAAGNSGVILSQMIQGFSDVCRQAGRLDHAVLKEALAKGARAGYASVAHPVEGTILTVARRAAESAAEALSPAEVFQEAFTGATQAVSETPTQLEQLRAAGVIDAGGEGLRLILEGICRWLHHQPLERIASAPSASRALVGVQHTGGDSGYCIQFLVEGSRLASNDVRARLEPLGRSIVVVESDDLIRVHVHADRPGVIIDEAAFVGSLRNVSVENMELQHEGARSASAEGVSDIGIVTVAHSAEAARLLSELGAARVIRLPGGEGPGVGRILTTIESIGYEHVVLLPNDKNALLAADQARALSPRSIEVVPTGNLAEAVACLVTFNFAIDLDQNVARMRQALSRMVTLEVAQATRAAAFADVRVEVHDYVVLRGHHVVAAAPALVSALQDALGCRQGDAPEIVTVYTGDNAKPPMLDCICDTLRQNWPSTEVEVVDTRQPHRVAIVAIE